MNVRVENVSVWNLLGVFSLGILLGGLGSYGAAMNLVKDKVEVAERAAATATDLLSRAECPESVFQEKTIMLPDGGVYKCGAVRTIPVNQKELERWYKAEARKLLKGKKQ